MYRNRRPERKREKIKLPKTKVTTVPKLLTPSPVERFSDKIGSWITGGIILGVSNAQADFPDALLGLERGDFSKLDPLFAQEANGDKPCQIIQWHEAGLFGDRTEASAEALTCACFLGRTEAAEYFLQRGVPPSGGAKTGLNAFHWAANRGQLEAVRLLIRWKAPTETRSMYGGNVLDTAVWSAINEPRPNHLPTIEELLKAGARLETEKYPTGHEALDAMLRQHLGV